MLDNKKESSSSGGLQLKSGAKYRRKKKMLINRAILLSPIVIILLIVLICLIPKNDNKEADETAKAAETAVVNIIGKGKNVIENDVKFNFTEKDFTAEDVSLLDLRQACECNVDAEALITQPLDWDMTADDFTVLILHTHVSESYTKAEGDSYIEHEAYRTENEEYNMVAIGNTVENILKRQGINVIHETKSFEYPDTDYAYDNVKEYLNEKLSENPDIKLVIDLHRDAALNSEGNEWGPTVITNERETAMLSFVLGTFCEMESTAGDWQKNAEFTFKLEAQLEKMYPDICRQTFISGYQYNQNLPAVFLLAEVGLAGNTLEEANNAAYCLSQGILERAKGANLE